MKNHLKSTLLIILLVAIACSILSSCTKRNLKSNSALGAVVLEKVNNAQYMPEPANLSKMVNTAANNAAPMNSASQIEDGLGYHEVSVSQIDKTGFIGILNTLGQIDGEGAGKYLGYDIFEIKKELAFVVKNAPYFGQWFRMPSMREEEGYIAIPYYENWAYYVESDADARNVTITSVCWRTAFHYYDFDKKITVDDDLQYQVMQVKYYFDEQNRENVECFVYNVAEVKGVSVPLSFQYLKNVKDTSLTLYKIIIAERYSGLIPGSDLGWDIRGKNPYGTSREYIELNYANEGDIQLLKISQILPTDIYRRLPTTDIAFYTVTETGVQFLAHTYDYASANEKQELLSLHSYESHFNEFDVANYLSKGRSLSDYNKLLLKVDYSDMPTRTLTSAQAAGDENALLRSLQKTLVNMSQNLGTKNNSIVEFESIFSQRTRLTVTVLSAEKALDELLTAITAGIVDNSQLKAEWGDIFSASEKAVTTPIIEGDFYGKDVPLKGFHNLMDFYYDNSGEVRPHAGALLVDQQYVDCQIRLAMRSEEGEYTLIFLNSTTTFENDYMTYSNYEGKLEVSLNKAGVYTAVFVLTRTIDGVETVVLDTLQTPYIHRFIGINLPNTTAENGDIISYEVNGRGRMLVITAIKLD